MTILRLRIRLVALLWSAESLLHLIPDGPEGGWQDRLEAWEVKHVCFAFGDVWLKLKQQERELTGASNYV